MVIKINIKLEWVITIQNFVLKFRIIIFWNGKCIIRRVEWENQLNKLIIRTKIRFLIRNYKKPRNNPRVES